MPEPPELLNQRWALSPIADSAFVTVQWYADFVNLQFVPSISYYHGYMKKFVIAIIVAAGLIGLVFLARFKPTTTATASNAATTSSTPLNTTNSPSTSTAAAPAASPTSLKSGSYTGQSVDVGYGIVEVQAIVSGGKLTDVKFLSLPSGGHSSQVSSFAGPQLRSEALQAQSANVDIVSGATSTSEGFMQSLQAALSQAS